MLMSREPLLPFHEIYRSDDTHVVTTPATEECSTHIEDVEMEHPHVGPSPCGRARIEHAH